MKNNKTPAIIQELLNKGNTVLDIALALRTSPQGVYYYIRKHNLKRDVDKNHLTKK
jgi:predicted transcriptional regulator